MTSFEFVLSCKNKHAVGTAEYTYKTVLTDWHGTWKTFKSPKFAAVGSGAAVVVVVEGEAC
jgi:hypothetical protein